MAKKSRYEELREIYKDALLIVKAGCFYETKGDDACFIAQKFGYKLRDFNGSYKTGFSKNALVNVVQTLRNEGFSFVVANKQEIEDEFSGTNTAAIEMPELKELADFSSPDKILLLFSDKNQDYSVILALANELQKQISDLHINYNGVRFKAITQVILEAYKRLFKFNSNLWFPEEKLLYALKPAQLPVVFKRLISSGEMVEYKLFNASQIDFNSARASDKKPLQKDEDVIKEIIKLIKQGKNLFITGHAGTGKSYILNKLKEKFRRLEITSTTGIAAVNVKGQTIHSWSGVGVAVRPPETIAKDILEKKYPTRKQIKKCKMLAVDEISMLNIKTFECIDKVLRLVREKDEPFGGIQVIFIGDFFQLPPVEKEEEERKFCFESEIWRDLNLENIVLKKTYRQNDEKFIKALGNMRLNCMSDDDIALLSERNTSVDTSKTDILHIFSTNEEADSYNLSKFNLIKNPITSFCAQDGVMRDDGYGYNSFSDREEKILEIFNKNCRADRKIDLKIGARVMLIVNLDFNKGLINGSCGVIEDFLKDGVLIQFDNGVKSVISRHKFEYIYHDSPIALREQYPLRLAYGITIHKSQGMTLEKLVVDCSRIFERGQAYVAMSRVKSLEGLYLKNFNAQKVKTDEKVIEFYESLEQ